MLFILTTVNPNVFGDIINTSKQVDKTKSFIIQNNINTDYGINEKISYNLYFNRSYKFRNTEQNKQGIINNKLLSFTNQYHNNNQLNSYRLLKSGLNNYYVPDDFPSIQSAVDNVSDGDTIIVRNGTYKENIIIKKPLTIQSEYGYKNCTLKHENTNKPLVVICNYSVTFKGFRFKGTEHVTGQVGIRMLDSVNCSIVSNYFFGLCYCIKSSRCDNNIFSENLFGKDWAVQYWGIWMETSSRNMIFNNTIRKCGQSGYGIHVERCNNNTISNNTLDDNNYGIILHKSIDNIIMGNTVKSNYHGGINLYVSNNNTISQNNIRSTYWDGIYLEKAHYNNINNNTFTKDGVFVFESYHNDIKNNFVHGKPLIYLEEKSDILINESAGQVILVNCENISIYNQIIYDIEAGIELWETHNSTISDSEIFSNQFDNIWLAYSNNNTIQNNFVNISDWNGISIYYSKGNTIFNNYFRKNDWDGIYLKSSKYTKIQGNFINDNIQIEGGNNNTIYENTIINNYDGIALDWTNNNKIYHNNFIINKKYLNILDRNTNYWDNGYPSGGNYWSNFNGEDNYYGPNQDILGSDGLGDTSNFKDNYPLMEPYGNLRTNTNGPYFSLINIPIQFIGFVCGGLPSYMWYWEFGDTATSEEQNPLYTYTSPGEYTLVLTVTDNESNTASDVSYVWIQDDNTPPNAPVIEGPTSGNVGTSYPYTFKAEDPDGSTILYFYIDWGDNTYTGWTGPYNFNVTKSHTWSKRGNYTIKCKAKDPYDDEGQWGELTVTMPRDKTISSSSLLLWFLKRYPLIQKMLLYLIN